MTHRTCDNKFFPGCVWIDSWVVFDARKKIPLHLRQARRRRPCWPALFKKGRDPPKKRLFGKASYLRDHISAAAPNTYRVLLSLATRVCLLKKAG